MAVTYASPGVYVVETKSGPQPIEATGTSLAAFVGITAEASYKKIDPNTGEPAVDSATGKKLIAENRLKKPTLVTSWTQYTKIFGEFVADNQAFLPDAVYGFFANGGGACYVVSLYAIDESESVGVRAQSASVVVPGTGRNETSFSAQAKQAGTDGNKLTVEIEAGENDTFNIKVGDEERTGLNLTTLRTARFKDVNISDIGTAAPKPGKYSLSGGVDASKASAFKPLTADDIIGDVDERTGLGGLDAVDQIRLISCPDVMVGYNGSANDKIRVKAVQEAILSHCQNERRKDRFAVLDTPPNFNAQQVKEWRTELGFDTSYAALYYPWVQVADYSDSPNLTRYVPPSGHVVGLYNRTDANRGVHKAPANDELLGAIGLQFNVSKGEQDVLNPIGVNCIRSFPNQGIRVWGARTLSSEGAWRYINVRRLFIMVETSLQTGMQWVVFEPNDHMLWAKVRRDVSAFLRTVWRSGALFGTTPEEAFYVKCDAELNPPEIRDLGQLIVEVGIAPVKPAEFVIFRVSQWAGADAEA